jgi:glycerate kinase
MRKIIIASDSFKGSLTSLEVARAAEEGVKMVEDAKEVENTVKAKKDSWGYEKCDDRDNKECEDRDHRECDIRCIEISDGGEGTAATLTRVLGGNIVKAIVSDPLGRKIEATYGIATISGQKAAIMEMAQASGLTLLKPSERNPMLTSTYGTGEMILDALNRGCRKFLIGIGGSATNDGGTGMLEALGFKFIDSNGRGMTGMCGGNINRIARIVPPASHPESTLQNQGDMTESRKEIQEGTEEIWEKLSEAEFIIACDVDTPFCGREGAAEVFGPQKGATPEEVVLLEDGMQSLNNIIKRDYDIDLSTIKGTGAAGGLGGAFHAFLDGRLQSGIGMVLDAIGFEEQIKDADLIITGEGRIDSQTCRGKVISGITSVAAKYGVPVIAIAGIVDISEKEIEEAGLKAAFPIGPRPQNESDLEYAMRPEVASKNISDTVAKALASLFPSSFRGNL